MSRLPHDKPSTADFAAAGEPSARTDERREPLATSPESTTTSPITAAKPHEDPAKPRGAGTLKPREESAAPRDDTQGNVRHLDRGPRSDGHPATTDRPAALLPSEEASELRKQWDRVQTGFVDEPRRAVEDADSLVAQTMKRVAEVFAQERAGLERQWSQGQDVSTEDLRVALKRYRSFFDRLLSV